MLLTEKFISKYPEAPKHMNQLSSFVFYRTYSRFVESLNRRETWKEAVRRAVEYNLGLEVQLKKKKGIYIDTKSLRKEAQELFDNIFNLKQFLSGRTHWVGGADTKAAEKYPLSNFNCSFVNVTKWSDLGDLFYLLLVGKPNGLCRL